MFVLRAIFWITVVALLMPREPDLGFGRPDGMPSWLSALGAPASANGCADSQTACTGIALLDGLQATALVGLARVKAEIAEQKRVREHASGA